MILSLLHVDTGVLVGCRRCECNGKGLPVEGRVCDTVTGQCLSCADNTGGDNCEYCVDGFYQPADMQESCQGIIKEYTVIKYS